MNTYPSQNIINQLQFYFKVWFLSLSVAYPLCHLNSVSMSSFSATEKLRINLESHYWSLYIQRPWPFLYLFLVLCFILKFQCDYSYSLKQGFQTFQILGTLFFIYSFFFFFFPFWSYRVTWGILVPQPGIEPIPPAVEVCSLNHWTPRSPVLYFLKSNVYNYSEEAASRVELKQSLQYPATPYYLPKP